MTTRRAAARVDATRDFGDGLRSATGARAMTSTSDAGDAGDADDADGRGGRGTIPRLRARGGGGTTTPSSGRADAGVMTRARRTLMSIASIDASVGGGVDVGRAKRRKIASARASRGDDAAEATKASSTSKSARSSSGRSGGGRRNAGSTSSDGSGESASDSVVQVLFEDVRRAAIRRAASGASPTTNGSDAMTTTTYGDTPPVTMGEIDRLSERKLTRFCIESERETQAKTRRARAKITANADGHLRFNLGDCLTNEYRIVGSLGEGTFGRVVECWDTVTETRCAVKVIRNVQKYRDAAMVEIEVLKTLAEGDFNHTRGERYKCISLRRAFDYQGHVCMVFDKCGPSLYDFLRTNRYKPFHPSTVQTFCEQLLVAVRYVHSLGLVHTDLKPENVLLMSNSYRENATHRVPVDHTIRLIDFGSTTFIDRHHSAVVSTRHYRAPEIILGLGWSYPCDMWSIGCMMIELLTGEALFQTHDNLEHLAMMQHALSRTIPNAVVKRVPKDKLRDLFNRNGALNWPNEKTDAESYAALGNTGVVRQLLEKHLSGEVLSLFADLVGKLLDFDPKRRITSKSAVNHAFFSLDLKIDWRIMRNGDGRVLGVKK